MTNSLVNIENISSIDLIKSEVSLLPINEICYSDIPFDSGAFGTLHKVISINGKQITGIVLKVVTNEEASRHALTTITLLHKKIRKKITNKNLGIGEAYPQLIGMPFSCFNALNENNQIQLVGLLMYDLKELGYEDFGSDTFDRLKFADSDVESKLYYSYQLASAVSFLHEIEFIHSDLSENSIWINSKTENLLLIDFDSGYHFDSQDKPTTLGKVGHWIGSKFRRILNKDDDKQDLTHNDRLAEENWVLANAIFEVIFGVSPYFFLVDATDGTKQMYLKRNEWPSIAKDDKLLNASNFKTYNTVIDYLELLKNNGLETLLVKFKTTFNKGFKNYKYRPSSAEWKSFIFEICKSINTIPVIEKYKSNKKVIQSKNEIVEFNWSVKRANYCLFNGQNIFEASNFVTFSDNVIVQLEVINDFGISQSEIEIIANKIEPKIIKFNSNKSIRDSIEPLILEWDVDNASSVEIIGVKSDLESKSNIEVSPKSKTQYKLVAYGNFNQIVEKHVEVSVISPEITLFKYDINIERGIDNVDLSWTSQNAITAEISPMLGSVEPNGTTSKNIPEKTIFTLTVKGLFSEASMSIEAKPFPIPIINSLFIPTPEFNLETNYIIPDIGINEVFVNLDSVNIDTTINYNNISPNFVELDNKLNEAIAEKPKANYFENLFARINNMLEKQKTKKESNEENF
jgi:serine/threonine protein kinase